ncbi:transposase [Acetobacter senegalensis]|uniref:transposase n=1 Tax=Acetobacter senegalensis TaxID=446692 RepID=UPI001EDA8DEC|nr:transposase [Acetobacter senegalensis]MCG4272574.1 transposase [Acetobacter senegalensis]
MAQKILIGVERRRRWSDERKLAILAEVGVDGASVSDEARRHDLTRQHLYQRRTSFCQRLSSPDQSLAFVPVAAANTPSVLSENQHLKPQADRNGHSGVFS